MTSSLPLHHQLANQLVELELQSTLEAHGMKETPDYGDAVRYADHIGSGQ